MFICKDSFTNSCSASAFLIFALVIWPIYIGKFLCLYYDKTEFGFGIYIISLLIEIGFLTPISMYLDYRLERRKNNG